MTTCMFPLGGLGNQLFSLAAGLVIAESSNSRLLLDGSLTQFGSNLSRRFELTNIELNATSNIEFINTKFSLPGKVFESVFRKTRLPFKAFKNPYVEYNGMNPSLDELKRLAFMYRSFSGQYQHFEIVDAASELGFPLQLVPKKPSDEFLSTNHELTTPFIGIHIRGGDFREQRDLFPEIPKEFYDGVIQQNYALPLIVFTDDLTFVKDQYPEILRRSDRVFSNQSKLSSVENLAIMSKASVLATANSTFSSWAGWFSSRKDGKIYTVVPHHYDSWLDTFPSNWVRFSIQDRVFL